MVASWWKRVTSFTCRRRDGDAASKPCIGDGDAAASCCPMTVVCEYVWQYVGLYSVATIVVVCPRSCYDITRNKHIKYFGIGELLQASL